MKRQGSKTLPLHDNRLFSGRKFNAHELQLMVLELLREKPAYGYELSKRFGELSGDFYTPSPGVLYPALAELEALGFAESERCGRRKTYRLTQAGSAQSDKHDEQTALLFAVLNHAAKRMLWMSHSRKNLDAAAQATGWLPEFIQARKDLQAALLANSDPDHAEQRRIIAILQSAAQEILNK